jgi:hypothetical protein
MTTLTGPDYYLSKKPALLKGHRRMLAVGLGLFHARYGEADTPAILAEAETEFDALIPHIPYIGGAANSFTDTLVQMTTLLALYRALQRRGRPVAEIGELVHLLGQRTVGRFPGGVRRLIGRFYMSRFWRRRTEQKAERSQQQRYPGDFVYEVVHGQPGDPFDWGVNYLECGVVKFFAAQGADEFTPYMCVMDYLLFPAMGVDLQRQGTLAQGCTHCDFRFRLDAKNPPAWPPESLNSPPSPASEAPPSGPSQSDNVAS